MSRIRHYLYRAAVVRYIDSLCYEAGDSRRNHIRVYESIVHRLCGIGEDSFRNYLHHPEAELAGYELPPDMKYLLQLYVILHKSLSATERTRYLKILACRSLHAAKAARGNSRRLTAEQLIEYREKMSDPF